MATKEIFRSQYILIMYVVVCFYRGGYSENEKTELSMPLEHKKTVYKDETNNKLYWPLDQPFYLWLSPSPDEKQPKYLMSQKIHENKKRAEEDTLANGIKLKMSGQQYLRWIYSKKDNDEVRFKFYADGKPPEASCLLFNAPSHKKKNKWYFGKGLQYKIKSKDNLSGVKAMYVSMSGEPFQEFTGTLPFNEEKAFSIRYYAVDQTGNTSKPKSISGIVDLTPPVTNHSVLGKFFENTMALAAKIKLSAKDSKSGLRSIYYKFDDDKFKVYKNGLSLKSYSHGEHVLHYYSMDMVKNKEEQKKFAFFIDNDPPKPAFSVKGKQHKKEDKTFISSRSKITLSSPDDKSGGVQYYYAVNNTKEFQPYKKLIPIPMKSGIFSFHFYAKDKFDNTSDKTVNKFYMDMAPPKTGEKIEGAYYKQNSSLWIRKETKILLIAKDTESGLKKTSYTIGEGSSQEYTGKPIQVQDEGKILFKYYSVDNVGNREEDNARLLINDNAAPEISGTFSAPALGTNEKEEKSLTAYPRNTTLFITAKDMSSGLKGIWYSVNGKPEKKYTWSIECKEKGKYDIKVRAVDNLGNVAEIKHVFQIGSPGK